MVGGFGKEVSSQGPQPTATPQVRRGTIGSKVLELVKGKLHNILHWWFSFIDWNLNPTHRISFGLSRIMDHIKLASPLAGLNY